MKTDRVFLLSVSDIAAATGARIRSVIFWADNDVLRPSPQSDRAGKGNRRLFEESEVVIAQVAHKLAMMGSPIGDIRAVAEMLRKTSVEDALDYHEKFQSLKHDAETTGSNIVGGYFSAVIDAITAMTLAGGFRSEATIVVAYYGVDITPLRRIVVVPDFLKTDPMLFGAIGLRDILGFKMVRIRACDIHSRQQKPLTDFPELLSSIEAVSAKLWAGVWRVIDSSTRDGGD